MTTPYGPTQYKQTQIETATPLQLVVMLYDGALKHIREAKAAIAEGDMEQKTQAVDKLLAILGELQATLDMERGGDIATNLNSLYTYFCEQVVEASVKLETTPLDNVETLMASIRTAWHEIAQKPAAELTPPPQGIAPPPPMAPDTPRVSVRT